MSVLDVEQLLQPVSDEMPCGENLEYDAVFTEMTTAAKGTPEQQMGDEIIEAQSADWKTVRKLSSELMSRTKDLRVCMLLTRSVVATDGIIGVGDGLALLRGLIERFWDDFHPQLDPDDANDPTMRINILSSLADHDALLIDLLHAPVVESKMLGRFSLKDVEIASGKLPAPAGSEPPDMNVIDGAFMEADLEVLQATSAAVDAALEHVAAIDAALLAAVGASQAADLSALPKALTAVRQLLADQLQRRGVGDAAAGEPGAEPGGAGAPQPIAGEVNNREDVIRVLDKACEYFKRCEPSSPVPLLLVRAKRLVSKNFLDIMKDIAPDGIQQAETVTGSKAEE